ncbi:MAG: Lrp/AsnC family transcriptional regulator [Candidatus Diapherotrites archaeon]|nr:Lrp/AsnC family transcriptional regulator [Candidatus Diapherotrites archaeon]
MEVKLDHEDRNILEILEKNAKTRIHAIARKTGMPSSTVHHRIKRMEENRVIARWSIRPNYGLLGLKLKAHILVFIDVTLLKRIKKTQKDLAKEISAIPNTYGIDIITGEADLLVTVRGKDMDDLQKTLIEKIQSCEGIVKTRTLIVLSETNGQ